MKLSVIIVNYNVRHFLEQCLNSVFKALAQINGEVIVVDNASVDDSVDMIIQQFPGVKLIASTQNLGFAKANNLGVQNALGEYILILNPDTILPEDCLERCLEFMSSHSKVGALGVRMLDGAGHFLPESKRGFPGVWNSFCKMSGIYKLFPKSHLFNGYYRGELSETDVHQVEVLSGAFMLIPKNVYEEVGGFDERYFMYGEDIDLSMKIRSRGYANYYYPDSTILHFKGESTRKASFNYLNSFYKAMIIFATQHLSGGRKSVWIFLLKLLIWTKATLSGLKQLVYSLRWMIPDALLLWFGFNLIKDYWAVMYHADPNYFDNAPSLINTILFALIWVISFYFHGVYEKAYHLRNLLMAGIWGLIINLMLYAMLPEAWRASRMLLIFSFLWVIAYALLSRLIFNSLVRRRWNIGSEERRNALVLGEESQYEHVKYLLKNNRSYGRILHRSDVPFEVFNAQEWADFFRVQYIHEVILCAKNMSWANILSFMDSQSGKVNFKFLPVSGYSILGSSQKSKQGEIVSTEFEFHLSQTMYLRQKRLFDVLFCILILIFSWLLIFIWKYKRSLVFNWWSVFKGKKTWVSYMGMDVAGPGLPSLKPGIIAPIASHHSQFSPELTAQIVHHYAWGYTIWQDLAICLKDFQSLDQYKNE